MLTKDLAICIRAVDYSETSQIVTFFARESGKISAIAKGSKRPKSAFDGPIEMLAHGRIVFADSNKEKLATLTEFQQQPSLLSLHGDLFAMYCCLFGAELLNGLTDDYDPHPDLFDSFVEFLQNADGLQVTGNESQDMLALLILFQLSLLREVGLQPILSYCTNCKTKYDTRHSKFESYFSSSANGLICRDCEASFADKVRLSPDVAAALASLKQIPHSKDKILKEIEKVLIYHFTTLLGRTPKMAKHIPGST
jgi:DNA repair protein RecO (recombination protein O)